MGVRYSSLNMVEQVAGECEAFYGVPHVVKLSTSGPFRSHPYYVEPVHEFCPFVRASQVVPDTIAAHLAELGDPLKMARSEKRSHSLIASRREWAEIVRIPGTCAGWGYTYWDATGAPVFERPAAA